jgi:hypothetical protein
MSTHNFNPYLDAQARTQKTSVPGFNPAPTVNSNSQSAIDYELQDYFDDTGLPVRYLFFLFFLFQFLLLGCPTRTRQLTPLYLGHWHNLTSCWQAPHRFSTYSSNPIAPSPGSSTRNLASLPPKASAPVQEPLMAPSGPNHYEYGWTQDNRWIEKQQAATKRSKWLVSAITSNFMRNFTLIMTSSL